MPTGAAAAWARAHLGPALLGVAAAILSETYVSFFGLGVQVPTASWGNMLEAGRRFLTIYPWMAVYPGLAIALTGLAMARLLDGYEQLRDFDRAAHRRTGDTTRSVHLAYHMNLGQWSSLPARVKGMGVNGIYMGWDGSNQQNFNIAAANGLVMITMSTPSFSP